MTDAPPARQRVDRWLWFARVVKTRSLAQAMVKAGHVRINRDRVTVPSRPVQAGDVLTVSLPTRVRILKVRAAGTRRVSPKEVETLLEDLTPPPPPREERVVQGEREDGAGRPTKRDRRVLDRLKGRD